MPDHRTNDPTLVSGQNTGLPAEKEPVLPLPSPPVELADGVDLASLSAEDLQDRLKARRRDIQFRVDALKHELVQVAEDVNVGGRPLMDRVRERPVAALGFALASGATLGLLWGIGKRARRRPGPDHAAEIIRFHTARMLESAATRVARGASVDDAIHEEVRRHPVVFVPADEEPVVKQAASSTRQIVDTALKTAVGIGVKTGLDQLTKRLTGHEETFEAIKDASDDA